MANKSKKQKRKNLIPLVGFWIPEKVRKDLPKVEKRFDKFEREFDKKYPRSNSAERFRIQGLIWHMETPLTLLILGHNPATLVELHAWLERFTLIELSKRLGKNDVSREMIWELIRRRTLAEVADFIVQLGLWDKSDKTFITRLKNLRDGIVHSNYELLSKHIGGGKPLGAAEANELLNKMDCIPYFMTTVELITKLVVKRRRRKKPAT